MEPTNIASRPEKKEISANFGSGKSSRRLYARLQERPVFRQQPDCGTPEAGRFRLGHGNTL